MAKKDYSKTQATVRRLLNKFGNTQTVTRSYSADEWTREYDPVTEEFVWTNNSTGATQTTEPEDQIETADGVLVDIEDSMLSDSLIKKSDSMLLILDISEPRVGDTYTVNGKKYEYITHMTVNPAGTTCLYKIVLRL